MSENAETARRFWETAEAREWDAFAATLAPDVVYETRQTRERVRGREAFARYYREFPGEWHLTVERVVADDAGAATWLEFVLDQEPMACLAFFTFDDTGLVTTVHDFWPEPYEPSADRAHLAERY